MEAPLVSMSSVSSTASAELSNRLSSRTAGPNIATVSSRVLALTAAMPIMNWSSCWRSGALVSRMLLNP